MSGNGGKTLETLNTQTEALRRGDTHALWNIIYNIKTLFRPFSTVL